MKKKKLLLTMCLSVFLICFLLNSIFLNIVKIEALEDSVCASHTSDYLDRSTWKWTTTKVISKDNSDTSTIPSIATDSTKSVHIAWESVEVGGTLADHKISYKRWDSSSHHWTTTETISTESTSGSYCPSIATDSFDDVHIVWEDLTNYASCGDDRDIFYKRFDSSLNTWTVTEVISTESILDSYRPSLDVDVYGNVHITWYDYSDYLSSGNDIDIFYKFWNSSSLSWTTTEVVSTESTENSNYPFIAVDLQRNVHISWTDTTNYTECGLDYDIFYKYWDNSLSSWTVTQVISNGSTSNSLFSPIAVDSNMNVYITWFDYTDIIGAGSDSDIFYKSFDSSTSLWSTVEIISSMSSDLSTAPSIFVDNTQNVHITWEDATDYEDSGSDRDILYKRWDSTLSSWTYTEVVSTESTEASRGPIISLDANGIIHITWYDETDYDSSGTEWDVFFKSLTGLPDAPILAFIIPNPTYSDSVYLDWSSDLSATTYYVYRSDSYIWSEINLTPIASVSVNEYIDSIPSDETYYYAIVAENVVGNSSCSNCQYVVTKTPELEAPELSFILPNPSEMDSISLIWDSIDGATEYYVYRSDTYIWSVEGLTPIATELSTTFIDTLPDEGFYFYVVVATDGVENSTHSNCEYIQYKLPVLSEFVIVSGLILGTFVCLFVIVRTRKKK